MTVIKALCGDCGEVNLTPDQIILNVYEGEDDNVALADMAFYEFKCPDCNAHTERPAPELIRFLLVSAECLVRVIHLPLELLETHSGPPLTYDDLLDFHQYLEDL
jgi:hypothetical protein